MKIEMELKLDSDVWPCYFYKSFLNVALKQTQPKTNRARGSAKQN